jgi:hypothetical protein
MFWLKECPRCRGDLHDESDYYGRYIACMQCGYVLNGEEERRLRVTGTLEREEVEPPLRAA